MEEIRYRELSPAELDAALLRTFNRYQETNRVWYIEDGEWKQKDDHFVDHWDEARSGLFCRICSGACARAALS